MSDAESSREANDMYFGSAERSSYGDYGVCSGAEDPSPPEDEVPGRYAVQIIRSDRRKKIVSVWSTQAKAEQAAENVCADLTAKGLDASEALVSVLPLTPDAPEEE